MMARRPAVSKAISSSGSAKQPVYPFAAIVGQEEMKLALLLNAVAPAIGGALIMGHRGTGKSTAVRALADLLPPIVKARDCPYGCDPEDTANLCEACVARMAAQGKLARERSHVPVVDLPLGATEDRVCGTINIERALNEGLRAFEPGLLARANRGFLYIDEVNLLADHLVDVLLDAASAGRNKVEREGISVEHPARFVLIGSGNPEEGELRPQLLDRFGLFVEIRTPADLEERIAVIERREAFERDPALFRAAWETEQARLRRRLVRARRNFDSVAAPRSLLRDIADLCCRLQTDGHRGELTIARAARALAALEGRREATHTDARRVAQMSLRHRLRRDPLDQTASAGRIEQALDDVFGALDESETFDPRGRGGGAPANDSEGGAGRAKQSFPTNGRKSAGQHSEEGREPFAPQQAASASPAPSATPEEAERALAPQDARLPEIGSDASLRAGAQRAPSQPNARRRAEGGQAVKATHGRYARALNIKPAGDARVALDAMLRACAPMQRDRRENARRFRPTEERAIYWTADDLRFKELRQKRGTLFIFAVDASGSMALNRISQAKGALAGLLQKSYVRRDRVALVAFRGQRAETLLPPSNAPARAKRFLDALPVGGPTPLSAGLLRALEVVTRAARAGAEQITLLIFTDGRANVSLESEEGVGLAPGASEQEIRVARQSRIAAEIASIGGALRAAGVSSFVVDTQNRFISGGEAEALAATLGARYVRLPALSENGAGGV